MAESEPREVIAFWFSDEVKPHWFRKSDDFDARVREQLQPLYVRAAAGEFESWHDTPEGALALVWGGGACRAGFSSQARIG
jgi:uncharacterized protein (DUF924 family)